MLFFILLLFFRVSLTISEDSLDNEIPAFDRKNANQEISIEMSSNLTLGELYNTAVQAYLDEDWNGCVDGFDIALLGYKKYRRMVIDCRRKCREETSDITPIFPENIEDLHFYEKKLQETLCLFTCNQDYRDIFGNKALKRLPADIERNFIEVKPYEYLHICYYKQGFYQDAANAAFTYLVIHQKHQMTSKSLEFYLTLPEVKREKVRNMEAAPFVEIFKHGVSAYENEYYEEAVLHFENSIKAYIEAEEQCRMYCEGPFDQGWYPEFTPSLANHFTFCLKCKRLCSTFLNNLNGDQRDDLFPSHYNYLQFSYYKLGKLKEAAAAVESYLAFFPSDETMWQNKEYYLNLPKVKPDYFRVRKEALWYVHRQEYELKLLYFVSNKFTAIEKRIVSSVDKEKAEKSEERAKDPVEKTTRGPSTGRSPSSKLTSSNVTGILREKKSPKYDISSSESRNEELSAIRVIATDAELGGEYRYVADGLLDEAKCESFIRLAEVAAVEGDGYDDNKSPHSEYERFEGLTLGRTALMVYFGLLQPQLLELFLRQTEKASQHLKQHFQLRQNLYFTYTHLVCRSALIGSPSDRQDFSHEIHADSCLLNGENNCTRDSSAYTWRDYAAIVYLNDDFEGGEFIFAGDSRGEVIQGTVKPRCGRMVAFTADERNLHGVYGIRRGKRCALALWFTFDEEHSEAERFLARLILKRARLEGTVEATDGNFHLKADYEDLLIHVFQEDQVLSRLLKTSE